ncbi:MAG: archaeosortase/exosortase family protein, partial [Sphingomonadaceae bacterium]
MIALARPLAHKLRLPRHIGWLAATWLAIGLLFWRDLVDLAEIWWTSSTFNHCLLVPPIIAWLIWLRWPELRHVTPRGWMPGLLL